MRNRLLMGVWALLLAGCAAYNELEPKTPLSNQEKGYIQLFEKKDRKFEIEKGEKYFLAFPAPAEKNYYLVLRIGSKAQLATALAGSMGEKQSFGDKIKDEAESSDSLSVYPITGGGSGYYWLIESVPADMELTLDYRYVPQWRFKYETRYAEYRKTLEANRVERRTYAEIGRSIRPEGLNTRSGIDSVEKSLAALEKVNQEILAVEKIFPPSILNSRDTAYLHYVALKKDVDDEMAFQGRFLGALRYFHAVLAVKDNPQGFLDKVDSILGFFARKPPQEEHALKAGRSLLQERLSEVEPFYRRKLAEKRDAAPFDPKAFRLEDFRKTVGLYQAAALEMPASMRQLAGFVEDFDRTARQHAETVQGYRAIQEAVAADKGFPRAGYFQGQAAALVGLQAKAPKPMTGEYGELASLPCALALQKEAAESARNLEQSRGEYAEAEPMVATVGPMLEEERYHEALGLLKQKRHLAFLMEKYRPLDEASVRRQAEQIGQALSAFAWGRAEAGLFQLHGDEHYLFPEAVASLRRETVSRLEDSLYIKVDEQTRRKVDAFVEERWNELIHVDKLYEDSVFLPAHDIRFTTGGKTGLEARKEKLTAHLAKLKDDAFPAKAIKLLYDEFMKRPGDKGVLKARAVVSHGKHYKGSDKEIKRRIHECDPYGPKWIVEPTKYRRVFALPITTNKGENTYLARLNIRVESDAKFPVFDVNIKLPEAVAKNAGSSQWYDRITLDKEPLKSEGRFTITTPSAANGYECQITPVRMKKDGNNFLDIYFKHDALTVLPVSVMVQKPIIKKN